MRAQEWQQTWQFATVKIFDWPGCRSRVWSGKRTRNKEPRGDGAGLGSGLPGLESELGGWKRKAGLKSRPPFAKRRKDRTTPASLNTREKEPLSYWLPVHPTSTFVLCYEKEKVSGTRRYKRISLPKGMSVAWYGGGQQQVSRVKTLGMGGLFLIGSHTLPVGANLTLVFEVPGGSFRRMRWCETLCLARGWGSNSPR